MEYRVRPYRPADRAIVRQICCDTALLGDPVDEMFSDREAFADIYTRYYTDLEPESALVVEAVETGEVVGYLLGNIRLAQYARRQGWNVATVLPRLLWNTLTHRYNEATRDYVWWLLLHSHKQRPQVVTQAAHCHINILKAHRTGPAARRLYFGFFDMCLRAGVRRITGQSILVGDTITEKLYARYGWKILERRQISKFERFRPGLVVYMATVFKEFPPGETVAPEYHVVDPATGRLAGPVSG